MASGADILELLESFGDERLASNQTAVYSILAMWSLSLLVFGLDVPTMTRVSVLGNLTVRSGKFWLKFSDF